MIVCTMTCAKDLTRTYPYNYVFLFAFTFFEAILVGFASANYTWQSVMLCAGLTAFIFFGLTVYAAKTETDFTGFGPMLFGAEKVKKRNQLLMDLVAGGTPSSPRKSPKAS